MDHSLVVNAVGSLGKIFTKHQESTLRRNDLAFAYLLLFSSIALAPPADAERVPIVLLTDCGVETDDQWALVHLALSPRLHLRCVITSHSPTLKAPASAVTAKVARQVLGVLPSARTEGIEVVAGASRPLPSAASQPRPAGPGARTLIRLAREYSPQHPLTVVLIGPATDLAEALLADPDLARRLRVVAMAFEDWPNGGDPWNVQHDPAAWDLLLRSEVPLVLGSGAIGRRDLRLDLDEVDRRFRPLGKGGAELATHFDRWLQRGGPIAEQETGSKRAWILWDQVTTAYLLGYARSEPRPRPRLGEGLRFDHGQSQGMLEWITEVQSQRLWSDLETQLRSIPITKSPSQ